MTKADALPTSAPAAGPGPSAAGLETSAARSASSSAVPAVPALDPGAPPLAILIDYDGTVALTDVSDTILAVHVPGDWEQVDALYLQGRLGSRKLMSQQVELLTADPAEIIATASAQPHDPHFVPFVQRAREAGIPIEIVSDGFGFFIAPAMAAMGLPDIPIATAQTVLRDGRGWIEFPNGNPDCLVCGTCKRQRVLAHQAAGRAVAFIGDGASDRYAAGYADIVFAKRRLVPICDQNGWPYTFWTSFREIDEWLTATIHAWRADPGTLSAPKPRPFFCGPELWGPGRVDPPDPDSAPYPERAPSSEAAASPDGGPASEGGNGSNA